MVSRLRWLVLPVVSVLVSAALFTSPAPAATYSYTGVWRGATYALTLVPNVTVEGLADKIGPIGQISNFQTNNPTYTCLNGSSINVWMAQKEFPGQHVVHNGWQGSQCVYGTWVFIPITRYHITIKSWIPQAQLIDPVTGGLEIPYGTYIGPNCYTPPWYLAGNTFVYALFSGDGHNPYDGTFRTQTSVDFDWNGSSISNYRTTYETGTSTVTLWYYYLGISLLAQCSVSAPGILNYPSSTTLSSRAFILGTSGVNPFVPGASLAGAVIDGTLVGAFNSDGTLSLSWNTDKFPSLGVRVMANGATQSTIVANDASTFGDIKGSPTDAVLDGAILAAIQLGLSRYNALTYACSSCTTGSTTLNPAP